MRTVMHEAFDQHFERFHTMTRKLSITGRKVNYYAHVHS